jgi:phosphoribosylformylglycinamidine cyclo-ligase
MIEFAKSFNIEAQIVGRVEKSETKKLTIATSLGSWEY